MCYVFSLSDAKFLTICSDKCWRWSAKSWRLRYHYLPWRFERGANCCWTGSLTERSSGLLHTEGIKALEGTWLIGTYWKHGQETLCAQTKPFGNWKGSLVPCGHFCLHKRLHMCAELGRKVWWMDCSAKLSLTHVIYKTFELEPPKMPLGVLSRFRLEEKCCKWCQYSSMFWYILLCISIKTTIQFRNAKQRLIRLQNA